MIIDEGVGPGLGLRRLFAERAPPTPLKVTNLSPDMSDEALTVAVSSSGKYVATGGTA